MVYWPLHGDCGLLGEPFGEVLGLCLLLHTLEKRFMMPQCRHSLLGFTLLRLGTVPILVTHSTSVDFTCFLWGRGLSTLDCTFSSVSGKACGCLALSPPSTEDIGH